MRIADLNTSSLYTRQVNNASSLSTLDATGKLYKATLEKANRRDAVAPADTVGEAFVYSRSGVKIGGALSTNDVVLENADGSRFTLNTTGKTVSLVAKGQNIDLYVYTPPANGQPASSASAVKYSFNQNGVMAASGVSTLTATDFSAAEISTRRDLDGNGKLGGKLDTATATVNGKSVAVATAGIFKVNVMGQDLFVVGSNNLEKQSTINAQNATLLDTDGSAWAPTESVPGKTFSTYRAVKNTGTNEWSVYATDSAGEVTRFEFDANRTLKANGITTLTGSEVVTAEVAAKRDLNADGNYGAEIVSTADAQGKLYKAKLAGADVYLSKVSVTKTDTTGGKPVSADGSLLNADGTAWAGPGAGYTITSMTAGSKTVGGSSVDTRTVYAYDTAHHDTVMKFTFTASGNNFNLDPESVVGIQVDAKEMATAEKSSKRDLNNDGKFGVNISATVDATGGLYKGSMLGTTFYVAGTGLKTGTTGSLAQDLSGALLNADDSAWSPVSGYQVASVIANKDNSNNVTGYTVYAYKDAIVSPATPADRTDLLKFEFTKPNGSSNWKVTADTQFGVKVDAKTLSDAEKASTRDLNGDGKFGVNLTLSALDATGGLWKGEVFGQTYVIADSTSNLQSSANGALDLSKALLNADGTAWNPSELAAQTGKLRVVVDSGSSNAKYTVYASTLQGTANATYAKYTFDSSFTLSGNKETLTTEQFAAAEKTTSLDLNADSKFGVNITSAVDSRGGLYQGSLDGKTGVYFKGAANLIPGSKVAADAMNFDTALKTSTGYWTPDTNFTAKSVVEDSNNNTYTVIATDSSNAIKKYVFDSNYTLKGDVSGDMKLADLVALENSQSTPRDLNGDGITGVQPSATPPDAIGGLYSLTAGGSTVLAVGTGGSSPVVPTDLSTVLQKADGTAWSATGTVDRYTLISSGSGYTLYTKAGSDYTEYTFGSDYKLDANKTRSTLAANDASGAATLDNFKLADLEKSLARDINGDSTLGAKITSSPVTDTIHLASFNSTTYTVVNTTAGVTSTALTDKALLKADGTRWEATTGVTIKGAKVNAGSSTELYVADTSGGGSAVYKRLTFGTDGKLLKTENSSAEQIANSGALGTLSSNTVDTDGGLFKTTVLGSDYYVVGTGSNNGTAPVDLTRALMLGKTGSSAAWTPNTGTGSTGAGTVGNPAYKVGGLVTNKTGVTVDSYDVYTYATDSATGNVTDVFKSTWDANFNYQGTTRADPLALVDVEKTTGRDLNKDGAFGFRLVAASSPESTYKGVTTAKVGGSSVTFLLAGGDVKAGTSASPLSLGSALLNEAGTDTWTPDSGYLVTSTADGPAGTRYVYAKKAGTSPAADQYMRYSFSTTSGKSQGAGTALTAKEMAAEELTRGTNGTDLDADGKIGAVSISTYKVSANNATSTGLLQASYGNQTFFATGSLPNVGANMNLSKALLKADGTNAWAADTGYTVTAAVTGPSTVAASGTNTFVYARKPAVTGASPSPEQYLRYEFDGSTGKSLGAGVAVSSVEMAQAELSNSNKDLNGDGQVGAVNIVEYKLDNNTTSTGLLKATVGSQTYFVADALPAAGTAMNLGKALLQADGSTPWAADSNYTVTGTAEGPGGSGLRYVYAKKTAGGSPEFQRYSFDTTTNKVVGSAVEISAVDMAAAEVDSTNRDLNGDNQYGATSVSAFKVGNNDTSTGLLNASYGSKTFMVADAMPATGTSINLSKALKAADGVTPWALPSADTTAGYAVKAFATDNNGKLYAYAAKAGTTEPFKRYEFDATTYESLDSGTVISAVDLAALEVSSSLDLNGDNQKGATGVSAFKVGNNDTESGLLNASFGSQNFLVAGSMSSAGSPMDLSKALKATDGQTAWALSSSDTTAGYSLKATVDTGSGYTVYAGTSAGLFKRFSFDANGTSQGDGVSVSITDMAKTEANGTADLNGDNLTGGAMVTVSDYKYTDLNLGTSRSTGLLQASMNGSSFFVVKDNANSHNGVDLQKALLGTNGAAWTLPTNFVVRGTREDTTSTSDVFEVYGTTSAGNGDVSVVQFKKQTDANGNYTGSYIATSANPVALSDIASGNLEYAYNSNAGADLNGDGVVGFKVTNATPVQESAKFTGAVTMGTASVGSSNIYYVTTDNATTKTQASGANVKAGALMVDNGGVQAYWSPTSADGVTKYSVKSVDHTAAGVEVWAGKGTTTAAADAATDGMVRFLFKQATPGSSAWVLDSAQFSTDYSGQAYKGLSALQIASEEAGSGLAYALDATGAEDKFTAYSNTLGLTGRDINGDGVVGISVTQQAAGSNIDKNVYKTSIGGSDYYLVGTNLSSGTEANPLALDPQKILMADANTVWSLSATKTVTGWSVVDPISAAAIQTANGLTNDVPQYAATVHDSAGGGSNSTVYFVDDGTNLRVAV